MRAVDEGLSAYQERLRRKAERDANSVYVMPMQEAKRAIRKAIILELLSRANAQPVADYKARLWHDELKRMARCLQKQFGIEV